MKFSDYINEGKYKWEGGSDAYSDAREIEGLIKQFDFYTHMIQSYAQQLKKEAKNDIIIDKLKDLGVTKISVGKDSRSINEEVINEGSPWTIVKSTASGSNKGIKILSWEDLEFEEDFMEIARQSEDEYTVIVSYNGGDSELIDYEYDSSYIASKEYFKQLQDKIPNIVKIPKNLLKKLDIMNDMEDDWGSIK